MKISTSAKKNTLSQSRSSANKQSAFQFVDNRPEASTQRKLIEATNTPSFISPDNSQAVIQRYTILNPADYQIQDDGQNPMFPSNQLENKDVNTFQGGVKSVTRNLKWVERLSANPPLKVSGLNILVVLYVELPYKGMESFVFLPDGAKIIPY